MKKLTTAALLLSTLLCACSKVELDPIDTPQNQTLHLNISTENWTGTTRATGEPLEPITLLLVPEDVSDIIKKKVVEADDYTLEIPHGTYDIFAVCGLPSDEIPDNIDAEFAIPDGEKGKTDFAVGHEQITNEYGKLSSSSLTINANRQMAWLTVNISDIPSYFASLSLRVKGLSSSYSIDDGWAISNSAKEKFTDFPLERKANTATADLITIPCHEDFSNTEFHLVATTDDDKTLTYKYISSTPLLEGMHLTLNLSIADMAPVSGIINMEDWNESEEDGTLTDPTVTEE